MNNYEKCKRVFSYFEEEFHWQLTHCCHCLAVCIRLIIGRLKAWIGRKVYNVFLCQIQPRMKTSSYELITCKQVMLQYIEKII